MQTLPWRTVAFASTLLLSAFSVAQSAPPSADTFSNLGTPSHNFGSQPILAVTAGSTSYISFNLAAIPAGVT